MIDWNDTHMYASGNLSRGYYKVAGTEGRFSIKYAHGADGRCIYLRHNDLYAGCFRSVGAAKRRALQIVKAAAAPAPAPAPVHANPSPVHENDSYPARDRHAGRGEIILPEGDGSAKTLLDQVRCLLDGRGSLDHCPTTGELIIRTGLDVQMGGELAPMGDEE